MKSEVRILLDGRDFKSLLIGGIVTKYVGDTKIQIALNDIGYMEIARLTAEALGMELKSKERLDEVSLR